MSSEKGRANSIGVWGIALAAVGIVAAGRKHCPRGEERPTALIDGKGALRAASLVYVFTGLAGVVGNLPVMVYLLARGTLPVLFGIPLDGGPFSERLGSEAMAGLVALFVGVSSAEIVAGYWLRRSRRRGAVLALALLPIGAFFWVGFALPLWLLAGLPKAVLLAIGWKDASE